MSFLKAAFNINIETLKNPIGTWSAENSKIKKINTSKIASKQGSLDVIKPSKIDSSAKGVTNSGPSVNPDLGNYIDVSKIWEDILGPLIGPVVWDDTTLMLIQYATIMIFFFVTTVVVSLSIMIGAWNFIKNVDWSNLF
jgi:hypothetical protein